ncbi:AraC family transcriptional regulator [Vibrio sp. T187]|uniref:helix-turn-helix domain-containing protein n=1 Tax=Vibrio TaxID=662 RepID=UPI0010C9537E|nr:MULTISPECIES: helix-turn-helix domain-containing protein [Vibrio]MBW3697754.1 AraC family transcriptional regulator [Vibrio sp. T187]
MSPTSQHTHTPKHDIVHVVEREHVEFFVSLFKEIDENIYSLLKESKIPGDIQSPQSDYSHVPESTLKNLMQVLGSKTSSENFGVLIWSACKNVYIPKFVSQLTQGHSLKEALDEFSTHLKKHSSNAKVYTQYAGGKWWLVRDKTGRDEIWFKYGEMFSVVFMSELLRTLTNHKWQPSEIGITSEEHQDFARLPELSNAQFFTGRDVTALHIPTALMKAPVSQVRKRPSTADISKTAITGFLPSFKLAVKPYLSMGKLPIKMASQILNINVRTIQRKLEKESAIYSEVIESMVLEQMIELIKCDSLPITVIAARMGYSDSAHFTRAFKRLTHMTPSQYRKSIISKKS